MVLTKEQRVELLARAREAKARKRLQNKGDEAPLPISEAEEDGEAEEAEEPEPEPEPVPAPKKKTLPIKWLKKPEPPVKVCCKEKLTKEAPVIDDEPQVVADNIVIPPKSIIKKPKAVRASTRTLELAEVKPIEEVFEEIKNNDEKYRPQRRIPQEQEQRIPQHPVRIIKQDPPLSLFNY